MPDKTTLAYIFASEEERKDMARLTVGQRNRAAVMAQFIDCSPHEWPVASDIPVLCHMILDLLDEIGELRERLKQAEASR